MAGPEEGDEHQDTDSDAQAWDLWLERMPEALARRVEAVVRRSLRKRLAQRARKGLAVPEQVRSEAVYRWRKRYMADASKSARRRKNYARLKSDPTYRAIERDLMARYEQSHGSRRQSMSEVVSHLTFAEVCERYRAVAPQQGEVPLEGLLRSVVIDACGKDDIVGEICEAMGSRILSALRSERMPRVRAAQDTGQVVFPRQGRPRGGRSGEAQEFHLTDVSSEEAVAERVCQTGLIASVACRSYGGKPIFSVARELLTAHAERDGEVAAVRGLIAALQGTTTLPALDRYVKAEAHEVESRLLGAEFASLAAGALLENPIYGVQYRRAVELLLRVRDHVPETPMEAYPLARTMRRSFVLHVGPTNSGKTHDALQVLAQAESGTYLGPLRLLAYEQFEELNRMGTPCSLLTGEESVEVAGARHVSSTVEMARFGRIIDVAVIDEAQMIADRDRGYHWTEALLGIPAHEVHVCCAPHAEQVVSRLVELCEDDLAVVRHERLVPLEAGSGAFRLPQSVLPGDALVVFSRRSVHAVADLVAGAGFRPSVVYGALPPDVRHEEARRFDEGETDVVVATDAIGMGMNLPIRRVVFVEQEKYDGHEVRPLQPAEVQQIAGRAGRYGRYELGLYHSTGKRDDIVRSYAEAVRDIETIPVGIPADIALVRDATLSECIRQWMMMEQPEPFRRMRVARDLALIGEVEELISEDRLRDIASKQLVLTLATMAFDERDRELHRVWRRMVASELAGEEAVVELPPAPSEGDTLVELEWRHRLCDLLYAYARTFNHPERIGLLSRRRDEISRAIMRMLADDGS